MDDRDFERQITEALVGALVYLDGLTVQLARIAALVEEKEGRLQQDALSPPLWINNTHTQERR
jgi:hypothetical protein